MDAGAVVALIVGCVAGAVGVVSLFQARTANRVAEKANSLAEVANQTSGAAVARAEEANRIAEQANQIAEAGRDIGAAQLSLARDLVEYTWTFQADEDGQPIAIRNACAYAALRVTVKITHNTETVFETVQDYVAGFDEVPLDLGPAWQEHIRQVRDAPWHTIMWLDGLPAGGRHEAVTIVFKAWIDCVTPSQSPRHYEVDYSVRHGLDDGQVKLMPFPKKTVSS